MRVDVSMAKALNGDGRSFHLECAFSCGSGRIVLFGPSGSGKTMTLKALAGLLRPDQGSIRVNGRVLFDAAAGIDVPARDRKVGYLSQDYGLFPHMSVRRNVAFGLARLWQRLSGPGMKRVDSLLEAFGLADLAGSYPRDLSGGQRQRVALARSLAPAPDMLLMDEPFSALDQPLRERARNEVSKALDAAGVPLVLVTHDPEEARLFGREVVLYRHGRTAGTVDTAGLTPDQARRALLEAAASAYEA